MQRSRLTIGLSSQRGIAAALLLLMTVAHVSAQSPDATLPLPPLLQEANASSSSSPATTPAPSTVSTTERIPLASGEIVEIMGADTMLDYTWTFSRDGVFLGATRGKLFRTRVVQPGTYSLKVDATDAGHTVAAQREFLLDVSPIPSNPFTGSGVPVDLSIPSSTAPSLVATQPPMQSRIIAMPETTVLRVSPSASDIATIDIDTNAAIDTDGNGNAQDDADTFDTFFHQAKNALYLWFPAPLTLERPLRVHATMQDGQQQTLDLIVAAASDGSNAQGDLSVRAQPTGDSTYLFTLLPAPSVSEGNPLLFEWSFGDGGQSLLEQPTHTYAQGGTYLVTVSVRSLTTGRTAGQGRTQVTASGATGSGTAVVSGATSSVSTPDVTSPTQKSGWLGLALRIALGILVVGGLFGGLLWAIFRILRKTGWRSRLDNALDKGFETNASGNPKDVIDVPAAPLSLRRTDEASTPPKAPAAKPAAPVPTTPATATPAPKPAATSPGSDSPAPAWLQKGLATTSTTPVPTPPPPTPLPTSPAVSSEPQARVQPQPAPATPLPPIDGTEAPAWLKRGLSTTSPPAPSIPTPSQPAADPAPKPFASPTPPPPPAVSTPASAPAPAATDTPAWLNPPAPSAKPETAAPAPAATPRSSTAPTKDNAAPVPPPLPVAAKSEPTLAPQSAPAPLLTPSAAAPSTPSAAAPVASGTPAPALPTAPTSSVPAQPVVAAAPAPAPTPEPKPERTPAPVTTPPVPTPPPIPPSDNRTDVLTPETAAQKASSTQNSASSHNADAATHDADERERERKRRKRQRYRDNLKRRKEMGLAGPQEHDSTEDDADEALSTLPTQDQLSMTLEPIASVGPAPSIITPENATAAPTPSSALSAQTQAAASNAASEPPVPPAIAPEKKPDDDIAFVISADSLTPPTNDQPGTAA